MSHIIVNPSSTFELPFMIPDEFTVNNLPTEPAKKQPRKKMDGANAICHGKVYITSVITSKMDITEGG